MKKVFLPALAVAVLSTGAIQVEGQERQQGRASIYTDTDALAQRLLDAGRVQEGEVVLIRGGVHDADVLESLAVEASNRGAFPLVEYSSDTLLRRLR